eukprot:15468700-Alexandrium_andersonii.AAC.1
MVRTRRATCDRGALALNSSPTPEFKDSRSWHGGTPHTASWSVLPERRVPRQGALHWTQTAHATHSLQLLCMSGFGTQHTTEGTAPSPQRHVHTVVNHSCFRARAARAARGPLHTAHPPRS